MSSPLLHTRVRDTIHIEQSPEQVINHLKNLADEPFRIAVDDADYDNIQFEMERGRPPDIIIQGIVRRWQGTESRLEFMAEVDVPPSNTDRQKAIVATIVIIFSLIVWQFLIVPMTSLRQSGVTFMLSLFLIGTWLIATTAIGWVSYGFLVRDSSGNLRWKVQQEMAQFVEQIRNLEDSASQISNLEEIESKQQSNAQSTA